MWAEKFRLRNILKTWKLWNILDIEQLKKKKQKTELEIATDEKNKETIANQIRLLTEKLEEIDARQAAKRQALAKIDDTLTQSEIGKSEISLEVWSSLRPLHEDQALFDLSIAPSNTSHLFLGYSKIIDSLQVLLNFAASKTELETDHHHHHHWECTLISSWVSSTKLFYSNHFFGVLLLNLEKLHFNFNEWVKFLFIRYLRRSLDSFNRVSFLAFNI